MDRRDAWAGVALAGCVLLGGWLRMQAMDDGFSPDELANIFFGTVGELFHDAESSVNPPLLRLLNIPLGESAALQFGRWISFWMGTAAIPLAFLIARSAAGGSNIAGCVAAILVAVNPEAVKMSARFRSYGPWMGVAAAHLWALTAWVRYQREARRPARWVAFGVAAAAAAVLPWLSYAAIPMLLTLGVLGTVALRKKWFWTVYVPAGVLALPLLPVLTRNPSARTPQNSTLEELAALVGSLQFRGPKVDVGLNSTFGALQDPGYATSALMGLALVGLALVQWRKRGEEGKVVALATISVMIAIAAASQLQRVRTPVATMLLVWEVPLIASVVGYLPSIRARVVGGGAVLALFLMRIEDPLYRATHYKVYDGIPAFAQSWHAYDEVRGDLPVRTWPGYTYAALYFYLHGGHVKRVNFPAEPPCEAYGCWVKDGAQFQLTTTWPAEPDPGLYVAFGEPPTPLPDTCVEQSGPEGFRVWLCR